MQEPRDLRAGSSSVKKIIRVVIALFLIGLLWKVFVRTAANPGPLPNLPGLVVLERTDTLGEADKKMQEAGFIPAGEARSDEKAQIQSYLGVEIFEHQAIVSTLGITEGSPRNVQIIHFFTEPNGGTMENPGEVFTDLRNKLTEALGKEPTELKVEGSSAWTWELNRQVNAFLSYYPGGIPILTYAY